MNLLESFRIALRALNANKVRAALTMLGVIIGVAAVILLVAIGTGVQDEITGQIEGLGSNLLFVFPGDFASAQGGGGGGPTTIRKKFTTDDAELVSRRLGARAIVVPIVQAPGTIKHRSKSLRTSIAAGNERDMEVFTADVDEGRAYNRGEVVSGSRVVMLGATVVRELFPNQSALGQEVSVNGSRFRVIGTLEAQGGSLGGDQDNQLFMPYTTAQRLLGTTDLSSIIVKARDAEQIDQIKLEIQRTLRPRFGAEFSVFTQDQTLGLLSTLLGTLTFMLAGIAGISLLVGGIGIMNIMLVSVSERTREIGIRKAVGARTYDILSQFVIEAVVLSVLGGAIGILLAAAGALVLDRWVPTQITPWAVALAFGFAAAVGLFFGVYPAWRASRMDPITALRYE